MRTTDPSPFVRLSRRRLLDGALACAALTGLGGVMPALAALAPTPRQGEGPFYPVSLPLDADNDLVRVQGMAAAAQGTVTHVLGRVLDPSGRPVTGARVEIWQCDNNGRYHHPGDRNNAPLDDAFQGFGAMVTHEDGAYRFRTIRPVPYPGRTPHIHFAVLAPGHGRFVTQMYVAGEPGNAHDWLLNSVRDPQARARLIVALEPAPAIEAGALAARFDIVLG